MRQLRFRAWDKIEKKMWTPIINKEGKPCAIHPITMQLVSYGDPDPVMQYTGLKDSQGKEIYEGDILEQTQENGSYDGSKWFSTRKMEIRFGNFYNGENYNEAEYGNGFYAVVYDTPMCGDERIYSFCEEMYFHPKTSVIIGNIYESPELLK